MMRMAMSTRSLLNLPRQYAGIIRDIDRDIERIRTQYEAGSPQLSHAPGGGGRKRDLSDYYLRVEDLLRLRQAAAVSMERAVQDVLDVLRKCRNTTAREMLRLIYIEGMDKTQACERCGRTYDSGRKTIARELKRLEEIERG